MEKTSDALRTISEVSNEIDVPKHVLRFWESKFTQIKPMKRGGGRRYYRPADIVVLKGIRHLLYVDGFTIRGVQQIFKREGIDFVKSITSSSEAIPETKQTNTAAKKQASSSNSIQKEIAAQLVQEINVCRELLTS